MRFDAHCARVVQNRMSVFFFAKGNTVHGLVDEFCKRASDRRRIGVELGADARRLSVEEAREEKGGAYTTSRQGHYYHR
jgi:hypothetical protein